MANLIAKAFGSIVSLIGYWFFAIKTSTQRASATSVTLTCLRLRVDHFVCNPRTSKSVCVAPVARVVKNAIYKLLGIDSVEVDIEMEKVMVVGNVDRNQMPKQVRMVEKRVEFWPYPNPPLYFTTTAEYLKATTNEHRESYNYYKHGYNLGHRHGNIPVTNRGDDKVSNLFNDDNPNTCSLK